MNILVTGGSGYIGSHTSLELLERGHSVTIVDNFSNSSSEAIKRVEEITKKKVELIQLDVCNEKALRNVFEAHKFDAVIHFAGLKSVGESVAKPLEYYHNNILSSLTLCKVMQDHNVRELVFSSSATVYGVPQELPLKETSPVGQISNPYGQTKAMIEQMLKDLVTSDPNWKVTLLRYFNPIGSHESGKIGEDPNSTPSNLLPYMSQVAIGKLKRLRIFGNDYETIDGTGVRDYIHVVDLAKGHVAALEHSPKPGEIAIYNLGTGKGTSVFQLLHAFENACAKEIPFEVVDRRAGDVASCYADPTKASLLLDWKAEKTINEACADAWRWQTQNPDGYSKTIPEAS